MKLRLNSNKLPKNSQAISAMEDWEGHREGEGEGEAKVSKDFQ